MLSKKKKKKVLTIELLEHFLVCGMNSAMHAFIVPYGTGIARQIRNIAQVEENCPHDFTQYAANTVSTTLSRMKRKKLITISGSKKKALWRITKKGKEHFKKNQRLDFDIPPEDGKIRLCSFDIPEERRVERDWLRGELYCCDYTPLQKSVFIGLRPLPAALLEELKRRKLLSYIRVVGIDAD